MTALSLDALPGYRRRIRIEPGAGMVRALLEDDIHCMVVTLRHDGQTVLGVEAEMVRAPWTTCPGAKAQLATTFTGQPLAEVTARREKKANCTHLHDLAVLAAAHADDAAPTLYEVLASDPVQGARSLEVRRDGHVLHRWEEQDGVLTAPPAVAGQSLLTLRDWIATLSGGEQEAARLLQWGGLVAHGRTIPDEVQNYAANMPANCYSFQPERAAHALRVGEKIDFSAGGRDPLERFDTER